jgi:hypothetical protein
MATDTQTIPKIKENKNMSSITTMTAKEARDIATKYNKRLDRLSKVYESIEEVAKMGQYGMSVEAIEDHIIDDLKANGYNVYKQGLGRETWCWQIEWQGEVDNG